MSTTSGASEPAGSDLPAVVARSADAAALHAPAPTLLLELQTLVGNLSATVAAQTGRGRTPFRPAGDWPRQLGDLAFGVYLLADQTGVDLAQAVADTAARVTASRPGGSGSDGFFEQT